MPAMSAPNHQINLNSINLNEIYKYLVEIVPKCGNIIRDAFYKEKRIQDKSCTADIVTETDQHIEKLFHKVIKEKYSDHHFIGEESTNKRVEFDERPVWIIDPVDGTSNFYHTFPLCCISIAFCVNKMPQIAVVYNPISDELFSAIKGQGAFLNGRTLIPSKETCLDRALVLTEFGYLKDDAKNKILIENMARILPKCHGLRAIGSAALNMCYVASGSAEIYYDFGIHIWDISAGSLIAQEAGCVVCEPTSGNQLDLCSRRVLVANSRQLSKQIIPLIKEIKFEYD